jgi:hypothetical protein
MSAAGAPDRIPRRRRALDTKTPALALAFFIIRFRIRFGLQQGFLPLVNFRCGALHIGVNTK